MQQQSEGAHLLDTDGAVLGDGEEVNPLGQMLLARALRKASEADDIALDRHLHRCTQMIQAQQHASAISVCGRAVRMDGAATRNPANAAAYEYVGNRTEFLCCLIPVTLCSRRVSASSEAAQTRRGSFQSCNCTLTTRINSIRRAGLEFIRDANWNGFSG